MFYKDCYRKNNVSWWLKHYPPKKGDVVTPTWLTKDHLLFDFTVLDLSLNNRINARGDYIR